MDQDKGRTYGLLDCHWLPLRKYPHLGTRGLRQIFPQHLINIRIEFAGIRATGFEQRPEILLIYRRTTMTPSIHQIEALPTVIGMLLSDRYRCGERPCRKTMLA